MTDTRAMAAEYEAALKSGDMSQMTTLAHKYATDDFVQEWPQSGERLTKENSIKLSESYPAMTGKVPTFTYKRMVGGSDMFVVEGTIDYGDGIPVNYVGIADLRDGKVSKLTEYFANPFAPPAWRADLVEKMVPAAV
jgi:SnoaL-like domain